MTEGRNLGGPKGPPKTTFVMTDQELIALGELAKPKILTKESPMTPQELSNEFWLLLSRKYGFDVSTVEPSPLTKDKRVFLAVPQGPARND